VNFFNEITLGIMSSAAEGINQGIFPNEWECVELVSGEVSAAILMPDCTLVTSVGYQRVNPLGASTLLISHWWPQYKNMCLFPHANLVFFQVSKTREDFAKSEGRFKKFRKKPVLPISCNGTLLLVIVHNQSCQ
jgi:hypothetical protein